VEALHGAAQVAVTSTAVGELRAAMAVKVTAVTAVAAALKSRVEALEKGGDAFAPGYGQGLPLSVSFLL
jgi:hypothetical protein